MSFDLSKMRRFAADLFSISLLKVFPQVEIIEGFETSFGFCYDVAFPFLYQDDMAPLIEEQMRSINQQSASFEYVEMVPKSAAGYFEHCRQNELATSMRQSQEPLVRLVRFRESSLLALSESICPLGAFRILGHRPLERGVRLFCALFEEAAQLKGFLKQPGPLQRARHLELGEQLGLFSKLEEKIVWHPNGVFVLEKLKRVWQRALEEQGYRFVRLPAEGVWEENAAAYLKAFPEEERVAEWRESADRSEGCQEGLLDAKYFFHDHALLCTEEAFLGEACDSSLQLIVKILKMLGFEFQIASYESGAKNKDHPLIEALYRAQEGLVNLDVARRSRIGAKRPERRRPSLIGKDEEEGRFGKVAASTNSPNLTERGIELGALSLLKRSRHKGAPQVAFKVADGLGRYWRVGALRCIALQEEGKKTFGIAWSCFANVERVLALLLEKEQGLPFWLAPEQVRLLCVAEQGGEFCAEVCRKLQDGGVRFKEVRSPKGELSHRVHEALLAKVPFVVVVGERELKSKTVTVRTKESAVQESMSLEKLLMMVKEEAL